MQITLQHYIGLSAALFVIGTIGVVVRKNYFNIFVSIIIMMTASLIALLSFARWTLLPEGHVITFLVSIVIFVEMVVGVVLLLRVRKRITCTLSRSA